ncbi:hypothetical protein [Serratia liquefaciens]|uniref:hypothetical protein n=1 Tax=Serratia liquefaciens TaxID=614 RepID=UPI003835136B
MKERPVIFNGEMVRAILDGRKTQTRRAINWKRQPYMEMAERDDGSIWPWAEDCERGGDIWFPCPFGQVGDRLWVREAFGMQVRRDGLGGTGEFRVYRASNPDAVKYTTACGKSVPVKWTPSIHMPRRASRILLEITAVRVERLNSISEEDAKAEGYPVEREVDGGAYDPWLWFRDLWDGIYPDNDFKVNPWVWVIEFRRVEAQHG